MSNYIEQGALADKAFAEYEFGEGVMVTDTSGWEYTTPGHERTRTVYVETVSEDDGPAPRWTLNFTVRFEPATGVLSEAYAIDQKGQIWGAMPVQQGVAKTPDNEVAIMNPSISIDALLERYSDAADELASCQ